MGDIRAAVDRQLASSDTARALRAAASFGLPASITSIVELWSIGGLAQAYVQRAANRYLAVAAQLTTAQKNEYAGLRTYWYEAQRELYYVTRSLVAAQFGTEGPRLADALMARVPYPGWLPSLTDRSHALPSSVSLDMRDPAGKRMFIPNFGIGAVRAFVDAHSSVNDLFGNPQVGVNACVKIVIAALCARVLSGRTLPGGVTTTVASSGGNSLPNTWTNPTAIPTIDRTPTWTTEATLPPASATHAASTQSDPNPVDFSPALATIQDEGSKMTRYLMYAGIGVVSLAAFYWFFLRTPVRRRSMAGLGSPTRLKALRDPVPSNYGLEVDR